MSKYMIKNCPSYLKNDGCVSGRVPSTSCSACVDCAIKRLVNDEKAKEIASKWLEIEIVS